MCEYYEYTVVYKECTKTPKHTKQKEKDVQCDKAKESGVMCSPVTRIPWDFGSTHVNGTCYECGRYIKVFLHPLP